MSYFTWSDEFSVNIQIIDDQHKSLIGTLNSLHEAHLARKGRDVQKKIVESMLAYAESHFQTEETYMQQYAFPEYHSHKSEHEQFTGKAAQLKERLDEAGFVFTIEILEFLKAWLKNHILVTDMKYSDHFKKRGLRWD